MLLSWKLHINFQEPKRTTEQIYRIKKKPNETFLFFIYWNSELPISIVLIFLFHFGSSSSDISSTEMLKKKKLSSAFIKMLSRKKIGGHTKKIKYILEQREVIFFTREKLQNCMIQYKGNRFMNALRCLLHNVLLKWAFFVSFLLLRFHRILTVSYRSLG